MSAKLAFLLSLQESLGGRIPFERWMEEALYHPEFGYYTASIRDMGRRGDFTTWPVLDRGLGRAIAAWARSGRPRGRWHLIEMGAGSGALAAEVLRALGWWGKPRYHIVEISPVLRALQQKGLRGRGVIWHETPEDALAAAGGEALIFSNELVDAFPCRIFRRQAEGWSELALQIVNGAVAEVWFDADRPASTVFDADWPEGQRVEVVASYRQWLGRWVPAWRSGELLTIDYGGTAAEIYHRRPGGTLRAYAHHQRLEGPSAYAGFGKRDLTADVNFQDLRGWGELDGLACQGISSLGEFVRAAGGEVPPALAGEAEDAFQVLRQKRG